MANGKVFNDPIHGHIELPRLCVKIIDTPEFQRLRNIKQLGTCYFVYPGATHTRFEHALGVCHLAGKLLRIIKTKQGDLNVTPTDILCVEVAGLCHNLGGRRSIPGHGPFAHVFDKCFIPEVSDLTDWQYTGAACKMFLHIWNKYELKENSELDDSDVDFIQDLIKGKGRQKQLPRPREEFLYKIISNEETKVDVCKWDYLPRDSYMLGLRTNFDCNRCIHFLKVLQCDGEQQLCYRDKEVDNLYDMFHTRYLLHKRAYQHKTKNIIDMMIGEALISAKDAIKLQGQNGACVTLAESVNDMEAYSKVTDDVFIEILRSQEDIPQAKDLLNNILRRKLYRFVAQTQLKGHHGFGKEHKDGIRRDIIKLVEEHGGGVMPENDVAIDLVNLDYGDKDRNPIDKVYFFNKVKPNNGFKLQESQVSHMLPDRFSEQLVRVIYKHRDKDDKWMLVHKAFQRWCIQNKFPVPSLEAVVPPVQPESPD